MKNAVIVQSVFVPLFLWNTLASGELYVIGMFVCTAVFK